MHASGASRDWHKAIFAYNHAEWYYQQILKVKTSWQGSDALPATPSGSSDTLAELPTSTAAKTTTTGADDGAGEGAKKVAEGRQGQVAYALADPSGKILVSYHGDRQFTSASLVLLDVLTPIVKSWPSQWCLEANSLAIQVHGGAGYTTDVDVELHYRDNRLNAIHEGTHGIQALDLLGRKVITGGGAGLAALTEAIAESTERARTVGGQAASFADELDVACHELVTVTAALWADRDPVVALANASVYLEAAGHIVVAWIWLEQLLAADGIDGDFYDGKRQAARYFFRYELPKTRPQLELLGSLDRTVLDTAQEWL